MDAFWECCDSSGGEVGRAHYTGLELSLVPAHRRHRISTWIRNSAHGHYPPRRHSSALLPRPGEPEYGRLQEVPTT
ncbi:hypothetical protein FA10DRAFT_268019 [Acaromyces ingoldii]|uniref:Uncharacterized protein n=1 Tax=Acaromyces ingoldii TaxID=215250 RepID=A0A316YLD2_9BASI|nr:hypothetical protein FA10DRAFT_268019 [Acaromyces ingoldii]PWN89468.1 hypothetical protein FA10DRAFT_268019 [Acaromyces ingoldii]